MHIVSEFVLGAAVAVVGGLPALIVWGILRDSARRDRERDAMLRHLEEVTRPYAGG